MRDYSNMPTLTWNDGDAALRAKAQILHKEPLILKMPPSFDARVNAKECGCAFDEASSILFNCDGGKVLRELAEHNQLPKLDIVAEACIESNSQVDVDRSLNRLIVHD